MRHIADLAQSRKKADTLIVLLPGAYHQPEGFITEGFINAVRERELNIDLIMAELSLSDIADQRVLTEIHSDLILPAITAGYQNIWIAGISIGGYVALAYASRYAHMLKGLLLLAPYPGNRITTGEITLSGGTKTWNPNFISNDDTERSNWYWLKSHHLSNVEVHLGYGEQDRFATGHAMMAETLPLAQVDRLMGDHTWPIWLKLWQNFLDKKFVVRL